MSGPGEGREAVAAVWRIESARVISALARFTHDFSLAEDVAQEALAEALVSWPRNGVPGHPAGWLVTTGRRRAIDTFRRRAALDERYASLAAELSDGCPASGESVCGVGGADLLWDPDQIADDVLALIFVACHPVLTREANIALTLRVVGGLTSDEIARAFLVPTATVQARITRAKKALAAAQVPFAVPPADERPTRLSSVLSVLYLIFTEGSTASSGDEWMRPDLAYEAIRLTRVLAKLMPKEPEVQGLLALLELTAARFPARIGNDGEPVLLEDQDRRRWDRAAISRGRGALAGAGRLGRGLGAFGLQAAIAECHAIAPSVAKTDWTRIVVLYDALTRIGPSPVVDLNRAVAVSMADGPATALPIVDDLIARGSLSGSHLLPAVRGELLYRLGRGDEARAEFERAVHLCGNEAERTLLQRKIARSDPASRPATRASGSPAPPAGSHAVAQHLNPERQEDEAERDCPRHRTGVPVLEHAEKRPGSGQEQRASNQTEYATAKGAKAEQDATDQRPRGGGHRYEPQAVRQFDVEVEHERGGLRQANGLDQPEGGQVDAREVQAAEQ